MPIKVVMYECGHCHRRFYDKDEAVWCERCCRWRQAQFSSMGGGKVTFYSDRLTNSEVKRNDAF